jgi:hypothetical protein
MTKAGNELEEGRGIGVKDVWLASGLVTVTESISSLVGLPSGDCTYVTARVISWSTGRLMVERLPADELKAVEMNTFEGDAETVTLAVALETEEVVRMKEVPRRMRKSWGMRLPLATVGPKVEVTVPVVASARAITCHGAVHVEDGVDPVLLQTEGRYEIRGSVLLMMVEIWSLARYAFTRSLW